MGQRAFSGVVVVAGLLVTSVLPSAEYMKREDISQLKNSKSEAAKSVNRSCRTRQCGFGSSSKTWAIFVSFRLFNLRRKAKR